MRSSPLLPFLAASLFTLAIAPHARAESALPPCGPASVFPPAGDIPADLRVIELGLYGYANDLSGVRLYRALPDGTEEDVATRVSMIDATRAVVEIDGTLIVGERYVLVHAVCSRIDTPDQTEYRAIEPLGAPDSVGALSVSRVYAANYVRGVANRVYFVRVTLAPSEALLARRDHYRVELTEPAAAGRSRSGVFEPTEWDVQVRCGGAGGVIEPGERTFAVRAIGGLGDVDGEPLVHTVEGCDDALRVDPITLRELEPWEREYWDREGPPDAGVADAAAIDLDAGTRDPDARHEPRAASCSASPARGGWRPVLALSLAALAFVLASRRARRD